MSKAKHDSAIFEDENLNKMDFLPNKENPSVVVIGASAGGLQAIYSFFENIEILGDSYCLIIMQHLSPDYKSLMPELLRRHTKMDVVPIENRMPLEGGKVFVAQPNKIVKIVNRRFSTQDRESGNVMHYPINTLFNSFSDSDYINKVAVILSGSGSDGTQGIESLKNKGAYIIVQDETTAAFNGMPKSAIASGLVDRVISPELIPETILELLTEENKGKSLLKNNLDGASNAALIRVLLNAVNKESELDFSEYKTNTILRRVESRMKKCQIHELNDYVEYIHNHPLEAKILASEFLINVTSFFRDREAFEFLKTTVIPQLFKDCESKGQLRIWCVGCATGQEPYSIAMLLHEYASFNNINSQIKVFATDANAKSINYASKGLYTIEEIESIPRYYIDKYFIKKDDFNYQVKNYIRDLIVFAIHNIIKDPPFHNINLLACRNLLMYLKAERQYKVLSFLHFSLVGGGTLFLGSSENPLISDSSFQAVSANHRIFRKIGSSKASNVAWYSNGNLPKESLQIDGKLPETKTKELATKRKPLIDRIKDDVLNDLMPLSVVVNELGDVIHVFGKVEKFLDFPKKQFHQNILKMIPDELYISVKSVFDNVKNTLNKASSEAVSVIVGGIPYLVKVSGNVVSKRDKYQGLYIALVFNSLLESEIKLSESAPSEGSDEKSLSKVQHLKSELRYTKDFLQNTVEALENSNKELQVTNEELQSTNEELKSVNEELHSVNNELQSKITEVFEVNNDLKNLLQSTEIGTIFLDRELKIRRYTEASKNQMKLTEADLGRLISDLNNKLVDVDLGSDANEVLKKNEALERQVENKVGKNYLMRMLPYRNSEEHIEGVVISFVNIDNLKEVERNLNEKSRKLTRINQELEQVAYVATHDLRAPVVNIEGLLDIHIKRSESKEEDEVLSRMRSNIHRVLSTLEGLIEIVSYQNEEENSRENKVDIKDVLAEIKFEIEEIHPKIDLDWDLEVSKIKGVRGYYLSIFKNLILNSIKYKREDLDAKIRIRTYRKLKNQVVIEVEDNGIGISEKYFKTVFMAFKRLSTDIDGKGIGLNLVKSQVEAMGGNIRIESKEGVGTKFIINL